MATGIMLNPPPAPGALEHLGQERPNPLGPGWQRESEVDWQHRIKRHIQQWRGDFSKEREVSRCLMTV